MSHSIHDVNGYVGDGPSITGRREMEEFLYTQDVSHYPTLDQLITHGFTTNLLALKTECRTLVGKCQNAQVKSTLNSLSQSASNAREMVILAA